MIRSNRIILTALWLDVDGNVLRSPRANQSGAFASSNGFFYKWMKNMD